MLIIIPGGGGLSNYIVTQIPVFICLCGLFALGGYVASFYIPKNHDWYNYTD